jgi:hypothetical protein|tara:strand:+ start:1366 stop:1662 length:297 start_codon:yes stop_codon:yes gene_type:complete
MKEKDNKTEKLQKVKTKLKKQRKRNRILREKIGVLKEVWEEYIPKKYKWGKPKTTDIITEEIDFDKQIDEEVVKFELFREYVREIILKEKERIEGLDD